MKQKHIIALCAVTTIAVLGAVAGTGAYLTHQTPQTVNTFAVGQLEAELTEPEWDKLPDEAKVLYPGKTVAKDPTACNAAESTTAAYMYLQVEIPRASVRTYTIAETAKADGSDETNQEPTSGAGVLDNGACWKKLKRRKPTHSSMRMNPPLRPAHRRRRCLTA